MSVESQCAAVGFAAAVFSQRLRRDQGVLRRFDCGPGGGGKLGCRRWGHPKATGWRFGACNLRRNVTRFGALAGLAGCGQRTSMARTSAGPEFAGCVHPGAVSLPVWGRKRR